MSRRYSILGLAVLAFISAGCSTPLPSSPSATSDASSSSIPASAPRGSITLATPSNAAPGVPGTYDLAFFDNGQEVATLPVCQPSACAELVLRGHVEGPSGPVQRGTITFQYCSYKGGPPNDFSRPDEAPSSACEVDGTGRWKSLGNDNVGVNGDASTIFGIVRIPRTVGFRIRYSSHGSGIAGGDSIAEDFTWTAQ